MLKVCGVEIMGYNKNSVLKTALSCLAIFLVAVVAVCAVAFNGQTGGSMDDSSLTVSFEDTEKNQSSKQDTTSSDIISTESSTLSSVASSTLSTESVTSGDTSSKRPAQYPENSGDLVCYLTFDDGPSATVTPKILATLKQYNAKATFFVVGYGKLDLLEEIHNDGHAIGLHSDTHKWNIYKSSDAYFKDLQSISDKVYNKIGIRPDIIRFPGGSSNTVSRNHCKGIMSKLVVQVEEKGYKYFDWNVDSSDADGNNIAKDKIVKSVINGCKDKNGKPKAKVCVLMHDLTGKNTTAEALPEIMSELYKMGYRFEALTKDSPVFHQGVAN